MDGLEIVVKRPGGELYAQVPGCDVRGAEVEPVPHPGVDDILQQDAAGIVMAHHAGRRCGDERQLQVPCLEDVLQPADHGRVERVIPAGVLRVVGCIEQRHPAGSGAVSGLPSVSARLIAVIGRQNP